MCGRTCLTLNPEEILCACKYKIGSKTASQEKDIKKEEAKVKSEDIDESEQTLMPEWRAEFNFNRNYLPSYNIAPTDITPTLVSSDHFCDQNESHYKRLILPMMWGMIPFWHKGDYRRHGLTTNNCRREHMLESKLYSGAFRRGQRCVVLCEGFYEWQTTKTAKPSERAAYLVYMPQKDETKIYDKKTWPVEGVNLLKMAGLFDVWTDENGDKIYSYSVITFESSKTFSWLHHRMPAILETEQQVDDWLDFKRVSDKQALSVLRPAQSLIWHRVSNIINNSRNKLPDCNKPIELVQTKINDLTPKNKTLLSWFEVRKKRKESDSECIDSEDETESLESAPKRQKFSDYKKSLIKNETNISSDSGSDRPTENNSS